MSVDSGLRALCGIAGYYRIPADPEQLSFELALQASRADATDLVRAANRIGLKARILTDVGADRLASIPKPAVLITGIAKEPMPFFLGRQQDCLRLPADGHLYLHRHADRPGPRCCFFCSAGVSCWPISELTTPYPLSAAGESRPKVTD
jgi:hypothetical protein